MPIPVTCSSCNSRFRVPDKAVGKRIKCPKCQNVISVPAAEAAAEKPAAAPKKPAPAPSKPKSKPLPDLWHVKMADGEVYGPVSKAELDEWVAESRIDDQDQVLREGTEQWKWASELYPELEQGDQESSPSDNPFDFGLGGAGSSPAPTAGGLSGPPTAASLATQKKAEAAAVAESAGGVSDKKKMVAGLLGIFLGAFGVHRFYLGYTTIGIIQIVVSVFTCCLGGWWGVIEGILILVGKFDKDAQGRTLSD